MKCALLQLNPTVGDIAGNATAIVASARKAAASGARLCVTPELALTGYPPHDLLLHDAFISHVDAILHSIARELCDGPALALGTVARNSRPGGKPLFNRAVLLHKGRITGTSDKRFFSCFQGLDENRYFESGSGPAVVELDGLRLLLSVGCDIRNGELSTSCMHNFSSCLAGCGPFDILINLDASPFAMGMAVPREDRLAALARHYGTHVLYTNLVGGNDELIFDGRSLCAAPDGTVLSRGEGFTQDIVLADLGEMAATLPAKECPQNLGSQILSHTGTSPKSLSREEEMWHALVLGVRDYMGKTGFQRAVLGLSGGVDSALVAAIACAAVGSQNVTGLLMPAPWSSDHSVDDAMALARNLGLHTANVPLEPALAALQTMLAPQFAGLAQDTTEENIQARIRGLLLMAHSNKFGAMLLNTGNKSELSVGYCTLYGDMCGALAVIADVSKTEVYRICHWYNAHHANGIPENTLRKPPSAELRPGQMDQDSLPDYDTLDAILDMLVGQRLPVADIVRAGHDQGVVLKIAGLVARSEFKRHQAPTLLRVSPHPFGSARRMPVAGKSPFVF